MIKTLIKYRVFEYAIETFFNTVTMNFKGGLKLVIGQHYNEIYVRESYVGTRIYSITTYFNATITYVGKDEYTNSDIIRFVYYGKNVYGECSDKPGTQSNRAYSIYMRYDQILVSTIIRMV